MEIDRLILGAFETNCYVVRANKAADRCLVIDAGLEATELVDFIQERKLNPLAVVLTHGHADHIVGVAEARKSFPAVKVYIHKLDAEMLTGAENNLSALTGELFRTEPADLTLEEGDVVEQAGIRLHVLHTPGHTPGGICLYSREHGVVFVGDTLFAGSIGRTDFPGGSMTQLITGIREKLLTLPDETVVYPGHGPITTVEQERKYNPYL
ncbi:MAG TPA: MBL fold metallo-hydrolase [Sedimentisphaerales bacterium]|nr:MBL fold metallo-hydrolase [Sedimentisphaerales bacterium]